MTKPEPELLSSIANGIIAFVAFLLLGVLHPVFIILAIVCVIYLAYCTITGAPKSSNIN